MNLSNYFENNIEEINIIAEKHKGKFERDVVVSNVFLYLSSREHLVNEENVLAFIIQWCSKLKYWSKDRCVYLMEERKNSDRTTLLIDNVEFNQSTIEPELFNKLFADYLNTLDDYLDRCIIKDYYENNNISNYKDVMAFYKVKKRQAFEIKKKISKLEENLYNFIKEKIC